MKASLVCAISILAVLVAAIVTVLLVQTVRRAKTPQPSGTNGIRLRVQQQFPVDVVFTWCEQTPDWLAQMEEYVRAEGKPVTEAPTPLLCDKVDGCELVYAVKSVQQFMPWVRNIFILTQRPQDPQLPGTTTVFHDQVVPPGEVLQPTFNCLCIESFLHRIPGLADHFIYFNDDNFAGRPLPKSFFFSPTGQPIVYSRLYAKKFTQPAMLTNSFRWAWRNLAVLFQDRLNQPLYHQIHQALPLTKALCVAAQKAFPIQFHQLAHSRFRAPQQEVPPLALAWNYGLLHNAVQQVHPRVIVESVFDRDTYTAKHLAALVKTKPHLFCLNNIPDKQTWRLCLHYLRQLLEAPRQVVRMSLHQVVPKRIWQTWHTLDMPAGMVDAVAQVKQTHPDFEHEVMDDAQCFAFIHDNFPQPVVSAFKQLLPGAYKADLWRYCVLYKAGGIYLDIKYVPAKNATFHALLSGCHFVKDRVYHGMPGIYNGFMVCAPGDARIKACIDNVVENVQNKYYGISPLAPTGPAMVANWIGIDDPDVDYKYVHFSLQNKHIRHRKSKNRLVECYGAYIQEQHKHEKTPHYSKMWKKRKIYDDSVR